MWLFLTLLLWAWPNERALAGDAAECPPVDELQVLESVVIERRAETFVLEPIPAIRWEIVQAPGAGTVERVVGSAERLIPDAGWVQLKNGDEIPVDARLWIHTDASLVVRFSNSEYIEFNAAPGDRLVKLDNP
jgi:hypothetical protein